jgi:hypothetical protein
LPLNFSKVGKMRECFILYKGHLQTRIISTIQKDKNEINKIKQKMLLVCIKDTKISIVKMGFAS